MRWNFRLLQSVFCSKEMANPLLQSVDKYLVCWCCQYTSVNVQTKTCLFLASARGRIREWGTLSVIWSKEEVAHMAVLWGLWPEPFWDGPFSGQPQLSSQNWRWLSPSNSWYWKRVPLLKKLNLSTRGVTSRHNSILSFTFNPVLKFFPLY